MVPARLDTQRHRRRRTSATGERKAVANHDFEKSRVRSARTRPTRKEEEKEKLARRTCGAEKGPAGIRLNLVEE